MIVAMLWTVEAWACSLASPAEHTVTENPTDVVAPSVPTADVAIVRGHGPVETEDGSLMSSSCDDLGFLNLSLAATDDVSAPGNLGYVVTLVEGGDLPDGLTLSTDGMVPVRTESGGLTISWIDEEMDEQDAFSFEIDIAAMDEAGNLGEPARLLVEDDGLGDVGEEDGEGEPAGCATVPAAAGWFGIALAGVAASRRRRRGR